MSDERSDAWKSQDRPRDPCPHCGTPLFDAYFAGGGWAPFETAEPNLAHGDRRCVEALRARLTKAEVALKKIDAIRNTIVAHQNINWSRDIYPLVAALGDAGYKGEGYEVARAKSMTLVQHIELLAKWIVDHGHPTPDHACGQCVPGGDIVIPGFVCEYHVAVGVMGAGEAPAKGGDRG